MKNSKGLKKKKLRDWDKFDHGAIVYNIKTGEIFSVNRVFYTQKYDTVELCRPNSKYTVEVEGSNDYELFSQIDINPEQKAVLNMIEAKLERLENVISVKPLFSTEG